ncbi:MAG: hypothetical protein ACRDFS_11290 [Chloroflexota bacterium]
MRRWLIVLALILITAVPVTIGGSLLHGYAQAAGPQGDEFNSTSFTAPFVAKCAQFALAPCPDAQGTTTWSLDTQSPGNLRIWSQPGSLLKTSTDGSNNARNLILQPISPYYDFTATTSVTFPGASTGTTALGQTAGLIVYQDDDNFLFVGEVYNTATPTLEFLQEVNGIDTVSNPVTNVTTLSNTLYFRLSKTFNTYTASYSTDNVTFVPFVTTATPTATATTTATATATTTPTATATATLAPTTGPTSYTAAYTTPQVGLFSFGGTNSAVASNMLAADFDWFRVGANSQTPGPSVTATATNTATATATTTATTTATATSTPTATATSTPSPTPTNTPVPTATLVPVTHHKTPLEFGYVSLWYHPVHGGQRDHLQAQAKLHKSLGLWIHVIFPNGKTVRFFTHTDSHGFFATDFNVPNGITSPNTSQGVITWQLWHRKSTAKTFILFAVK